MNVWVFLMEPESTRTNSLRSRERGSIRIDRLAEYSGQRGQSRIVRPIAAVCATINQMFDRHSLTGRHPLDLVYGGDAAQRSSARANAKASLARLGRDIPRSVPIRRLRAPKSAAGRGGPCSAAEGLGALSHLVRAERRTLGG
jgi:hypothetical protein